MIERTQGDWHSMGWEVFAGEGYENPIADCGFDLPDGEDLANARLIAVAPDLLALVEEFLACRWDDVGPYGKAEEIIAKVKGPDIVQARPCDTPSCPSIAQMTHAIAPGTVVNVCYSCAQTYVADWAKPTRNPEQSSST